MILIDPWITNPANPEGKDDLAALDKVDLILVSHRHFDHIGDSVDIAKRTGAQLVTNYDLGSAMVADIGFPAKQADFGTQGNAGGTITVLDGEVSMTFEPAVHGSTLSPPPASAGGPQQVLTGGEPGGFVIRIQHGPTFYHTADTAVFGDMQLIGAADHINVMPACIGDHFTMGPKGAALAMQLVHPDLVIPMHYGTFPVLTGTQDELNQALKARHLNTKMKVLTVDEAVSF